MSKTFHVLVVKGSDPVQYVKRDGTIKTGLTKAKQFAQKAAAENAKIALEEQLRVKLIVKKHTPQPVEVDNLTLEDARRMG